MSDPFASALDALFYGPASEAAEYLSIYGQRTVDLRIIRSRPDRTVRFGENQVIAATIEVEIRKSQVPVVLAGDTIFVGDIVDGVFEEREELALTGEPMQDEEGLTWRIGAEPVDVSR